MPVDACGDDAVAFCLCDALSIHMPDKNDGSKRLYMVACRTVEHNLNESQAIHVVRTYECIRPFPRQWTDAEIINRVRHAEKKCKRGVAADADTAPHPADRAEPGQLVMRCIADVQPEEVEWLWADRFPLGKLSDDPMDLPEPPPWPE